SKAYAGRRGVLRSHKSTARAAKGASTPSTNRTGADRAANRLKFKVRQMSTGGQNRANRSVRDRRK
ncbi:hypothetical protein ACJRO7_014587, partial [Eucalyptus globulus]